MKRSARQCLIAALLAAGVATGFAQSQPSGAGSAPIAPPPPDPPNSIVQQPRAFGYVIGDVVTQRVLLQLNGKEFVPAELPSAGRAGVWFERRAARVERDAQGRRWLAVDFQLLNAPQALAFARIPAWKLKNQDESAELRVAEWRVTAGPMTPQQPFSRAGLGSLRPDKAALPVPLAPIRRAFSIGLAGMLLTLVGWLAWWAWRNWRASASQPFAVALREMRNVNDTAPEAWHALHRAFDGTAGRTVRLETLPELFSCAPYLQTLRPAIEEFFRASAARFFGGQEPARAISVHALCRDLRRIEKRHEP